MKGGARLRWLTLALLAAATTARAADVPYLSGRVVDNADILRLATRKQLTATLEAHERATGNQIAVLTISTINGEAIESYATRVFAGWKLGQKDKDNGVLVVVVPRDRKMRIEVGYGLEGTLTDATSGRIIRNVMTPRFKAGDYDRGVSDGVSAVVAELEGRPDVTSRLAATERFHGPDMPWPARILVGLFIFIIVGVFTLIGIMTPGVGWFLYVFLIPFWAMFAIVIAGVPAAFAVLGVFVVGYPIVKIRLRRTAWYQKVTTELQTKGSTSVAAS